MSEKITYKFPIGSKVRACQSGWGFTDEHLEEEFTVVGQGIYFDNIPGYMVEPPIGNNLRPDWPSQYIGEQAFELVVPHTEKLKKVGLEEVENVCGEIVQPELAPEYWDGIGLPRVGQQLLYSGNKRYWDVKKVVFSDGNTMLIDRVGDSSGTASSRLHIRAEDTGFMHPIKSTWVRDVVLKVSEDGSNKDLEFIEAIWEAMVSGEVDTPPEITG